MIPASMNLCFILSFEHAVVAISGRRERKLINAFFFIDLRLKNEKFSEWNISLMTRFIGHLSTSMFLTVCVCWIFLMIYWLATPHQIELHSAYLQWSCFLHTALLLSWLHQSKIGLHHTTQQHLPCQGWEFLLQCQNCNTSSIEGLFCEWVSSLDSIWTKLFLLLLCYTWRTNGHNVRLSQHLHLLLQCKVLESPHA